MQVRSGYRAGRYISIRWFSGNQQFDAEVSQTGAYIDQDYFPATAFLEVTCVMHPNDYLSRELLDTKGFAYGLEGLRRLKNGEIESTPTVHTNHEFIDSYSELLLKQIEKKGQIKYPSETTLILQCSLNTLYTLDEWEILATNIRNQLPEHQFREIFMFDTTLERSCSIWPKSPITH